ncbi:hypothetical protein ACLESO_24685 [Pyxidicoccus sp. 3LG]
MEIPPSRPAPRRLTTLEQERRVRAWRSTTSAAALVTVTELAYVFIDLKVYPEPWMALARAAHVGLCVALLGWLLVRRETSTARLTSGVFVAMVVPMLPLFAYAEVSMAATHTVWAPLMGHRLVMLGVGLFAPAGFGMGAGLIGAFALESVLLWYGLRLGERLPDMVWEPWVTLVYGVVAGAMLAFRVRTRRTEYRLRRARAEAESLERLARLFLAVRDASNTPLQTLQVGTTLLRQRAPECAAVLDSMERALQRLQGLTDRMASSDPLLVWREGEESFDADAVLEHLEQSLHRELERRRH